MASTGVAAASLAGNVIAAGAEVAPSASKIGNTPDTGRPLDMVNPMQGSDSDPLFSRGNTLPIVAMPFGMAHWTLRSDTSREPWFFHPDDNRLEGVRCTHQLSPWLSDYGYATFLPFSGSPSFGPSGRASSYRSSDLAIGPHFLKVQLLRYRCELRKGASSCSP